ncbi:phosphotransferase [Sulfitobacter guttiformis]|uniref:Phosphotransferase family enzyme n=1 Tax=Sulfitobacter guttiformis TaxID=74349 RepID=A0A420DRT0_9RHOB|nr:phosphotransferase [Sulfitobacter guttiformis]KIN74443.1 ATP-dependent protease peptidase subunit [Sulfitobacter guttiformis KCTC 32187]RKE97041.1 phosphotransferase family enzyme [Sulfitobacter guttiformis]
MPQTTILKIEAHRLFCELGAQAGLAVTDYRCGAEWIKDDRNRLHIVQRYDNSGAPSVVLKFAQRPVDKEAFGRILDAHHGAQAALSGSELNTVPQILAEDRCAQAYLMQYIAGDTFLELCRNQSNHTPLLRKAGAWLAAFHGGTFQQKRPFQPRFMVRHMGKLAGQMRVGERRISGQGQFITYADRIGEFAGTAEGHIGTIAAKHGDLNAHNILISDHATAGFDFLGTDNAPVAYDIARFLQSYTQLVGDMDDLKTGHAVPQRAWDAFFSGYDLVGADDPTVIFLSKVQILTDWNRMQDKTTLKSLLRLERLKEIARQAFT